MQKICLFICKQANQFGGKAVSWFVPSLCPVSLHTSGMMRMEINTGKLIFQNSQVRSEMLSSLSELTRHTELTVVYKIISLLFPMVGWMQLDLNLLGWHL